jgi:hypothetical protein
LAVVLRVRFTTDGRGANGGSEVRLLVDGRDLAELVREVELPHARAEGAPSIAGAYAGLAPSQLCGGLRSHFLGGEGSDLACGAREKTVLLGCDCGEPGCWPLMARVSIEGDAVVWSEFEQPHRRDAWSYEGFGPLRFAREQYEAALAEAESAIFADPAA